MLIIAQSALSISLPRLRVSYMPVQLVVTRNIPKVHSVNKA